MSAENPMRVEGLSAGTAFEWFGQVLDGDTPVGRPFPLRYGHAPEWDREHRIASDASEKE